MLPVVEQPRVGRRAGRPQRRVGVWDGDWDYIWAHCDVLTQQRGVTQQPGEESRRHWRLRDPNKCVAIEHRMFSYIERAVR